MNVKIKTKTERLELRLTLDEKTAIKLEAKKRSITVSEYILLTLRLCG